jgi:hypothetical protein
MELTTLKVVIIIETFLIIIFLIDIWDKKSRLRLLLGIIEGLEKIIDRLQEKK